MKKGILIGCMIIGLLVLTGSAEAYYDYEVAYGYSGRDAELRNAVAMDDWLERGRAAVTESPLFPDGIRLTAEGGDGAGEAGLASAIYYFTIPRGVQYLTIHIQYNDTSYDDQIAGRLWIKSNDTDMRRETGTGDEAPLYGDTFVLRSERSTESITVPTSRHVEGGTVELHVVVQGTDCIDVRDIRVEYLYTRPQITVVHRTCNDYWDRWPRYRYAYHYFYWGPLFWPNTSVAYVCWDVPIGFYWVTWRPWFFVNIVRVHHHRPWWGPRRYTVVYHVDRKQPVFKRRTVLRTRLKEHQVQVTRILHKNPTARTNDRTHPERPRLPQGQEVRLKKETQPSRTFGTRVNPNPNHQSPIKQPVRVEKKPEKKTRTVDTKGTVTPVRSNGSVQQVRSTKQYKTPQAPTRTKTITGSQASNKPDVRSARPADTEPQRIQKKQPQVRTVKQPRSKPEVRETVRGPAKVQADQGSSTQREPTVQRRVGIGQGAKAQSHGGSTQPQLRRFR